MSKKLAQRLDCEIIALGVTDRPLQFSGESLQRESDRFIDMDRKSVEKFTLQASVQGFKVEHIIDIASPEEVVARVSAEDAGM